MSNLPKFPRHSEYESYFKSNAKQKKYPRQLFDDAYQLGLIHGIDNVNTNLKIRNLSEIGDPRLDPIIRELNEKLENPDSVTNNS